jgi:hypothetical protein
MPESSAASDATADGPDAAETEAAEAPEVEEFTNRAARRAKGKGSSTPGVAANGKRPIGRNGVQSPRQYGTRRSG